MKDRNAILLRVLVASVVLGFPEILHAAAIDVTESGESPIELAAFILGGIGIFLIGISMAGAALRKMTGGSFHKLVARVGDNAVGAMMSGIMLGFMTQSGKAAAFILSDFVQAGMLKVGRAAPIVFWANAGCSLIVFASLVSLKVLALVVLGVTALGITFHVPRRLVQGYSAVFGLAMIMYGLYLIKSGASGFAAEPWAAPLLDYLHDRSLHNQYIAAFLIGMVMTLLVQSNLAISMIAIALAGTQLFELPETAMVIYGAQAGAGILTYLFSFHSRGRARQVVMTQIAFDAIATLVFVAMFYAEVLFGVPFIMAAARSIAANTGNQALVLTLLFQFGAAALLIAMKAPLLRKIDQLFPPSAAEVLSQPEYLRRNISDSPESAMMLIEREQSRLLARLPQYLQFVRDEAPPPEAHHPAAYHEAFKQIASDISTTLADISSRSLSDEDTNQLMRVARLEEQLVNLEDIVYRLSEKLLSHERDSKAGELGRSIMESVDFIIMTAIDAIETREAGEIDTLEMLTQDRSVMMAKIRNDYFESHEQLSSRDRDFVLDVTFLFENAVHTLNRYTHLLRAIS